MKATISNGKKTGDVQRSRGRSGERGSRPYQKYGRNGTRPCLFTCKRPRKEHVRNQKKKKTPSGKFAEKGKSTHHIVVLG